MFIQQENSDVAFIFGAFLAETGYHPVVDHDVYGDDTWD